MTCRLKTLSCVLFTCIAAAGCSTAEHEDLKGWMNEQAKGMKGKVPPLPEIKPFPVVSYEAEKALSPFSGGKVLTAEMAKDQSTPASDRPKQPLESFLLEDLQVTGVLFDGKSYIAIVQTPRPNKPKYVRVGEFMGQNFGKVVGIDHCQVRIIETVKDTNGAWTDREVVKQLPQTGGQKCNLISG
jgi:type IV pilus assembly protein PilP